MEGLTVRGAQHSDYEAVMEVNEELYDGLDYMQHMYHHFIQHALCYVALIHSRVVGFICFYPVDGGRRAVSMASRIHKQFHGQHLMPLMGTLAMQDLLQRYPHIERLSWATDSADTRTRRAQDPKYGIIPAHTWDYLLYQVPLPDTDLARKLSMVSFTNIQRLDKAGIHNLSLSTMDTLFGGYPYIEALFNWFPLSVSKQSLEWIEREGHLAVSPSSAEGGSTEYNMLSHSTMVKTFHDCRKAKSRLYLREKMEGLTVRRAKHSDYQAVMDINQNIADGRDYMPFMYHHFVQHAHCYVALIHSRLIAFMGFIPVDGGRRVMSMANRCHKEFLGHHLVPQMGLLATQDLLQHCPNLERFSWATHNPDTRTRRAQDPKYGIIPARTWDYIIYDVPLPLTGLTKMLSTVPFPNIQRLDKAGIRGLSTSTMNTLFGGYPYIEALFNWFPLSVSKQSLEWIEREGHLAVSPSSSPGGSTEYTMLSHSNILKKIHGMCLHIYLCAHKPDPHTELQHILYHLHASIPTAPPEGTLAIAVNLVGVGELKEMNGLLQRYLGQPIEQGQRISGDNLVAGLDIPSKL